MSKLDIFCKTINDDFLNRNFTLKGLREHLKTQKNTEFTKGNLYNLVYLSMEIGCIYSHSWSYPATYTVKRKVENYELSKESTKANRHSLGNHTDPSENETKSIVIDHCYTMFSSHCKHTKSVLALCGTNIDRFVTNVRRISNSDCEKVKIIECDPVRRSKIDQKISKIKRKEHFPDVDIDGNFLQEFSKNQNEFYQFQELDAEGHWDHLFDSYLKMLSYQATNTEIPKAFLLSSWAGRSSTKEVCNQRVSNLLSVLGATLENDIYTGELKKFKGNFRYVHQYDDIKFENKGRIIDYKTYVYAQVAQPVLTSFIIYV
jgi:hypothetical protein